MTANTTLVKDSIVGDDWIRATAATVPIQRIIDPLTGQPTGEILTGPVRIGYHDLFELPKPRPGKGIQSSDPKFGARLLFTPLADMTILYEEFYRLAGQHFADKYNPHMNPPQYVGVRSPFRDQAEKAKQSGHTPGCIFLTCTSKFQPPVVDPQFNPIVDRSQVYSGVWAICAIKPYHYPNPTNPGIAFGLQTVMIIGGDQKLAGGGPDARKHFAGINVAAPVIRPDLAAGMAHLSGQGAPAPAAGIPGYTAPGGGVPRPGAPVTNIPQTHYTPPAQTGYATPPAYTPPGAAAAADDEDTSFLNME